MILIDAIFINGGGGKILLDYLFEFLENETSTGIVMLIDERIQSEYELKRSNHISFIFLKGFSERNKYYKESGKQYSKVLCFGNIPPNIRLKAEVYTYFHQPMFLKIPKEFRILENLKFRLKIIVLRLLAKNSDYWLVQSKFIKDELIKKFSLDQHKVMILPFYPAFKDERLYVRDKNSFIYISNATPHKNHKKLIDAFCRFFDEVKKGRLILTVKEDYYDVYHYIAEKKSKGYPIENLGFINREELYRYYQSTEYLIFPSLAESYGLGIIEAIENGCKVIGADLPYMNEICQPSLVFDPNSIDSICKSLHIVTTEESIPVSTIKTGNQIKELLKLLTK